MLLHPLGIDPVWVGRGDLDEESLYYGADEGVAAGAGVALHHDPAAAVYFEVRRVLTADRIRMAEWEGAPWPVLFGREEDDLLASAFFWLAAWQEFVSPERDEHGRFPHAASLQKTLGTTTRPVVDAYREMLADRLRRAGIPLHRRTWQGRPWALCPTHDIDYLRKWRPGIILREVVHYLLLNRQKAPLAGRVRRFGRVLRDAARRGDPYREAMVRMQEAVVRSGGTATYFFKAAARDPHDVPYHLGGAFLGGRFAALRRDGFEVGLHPSYVSHDDEGYMREERDRLAGAWGAPVRSIRQHYLRYEWPATARLHERLGFRLDSTLGFAAHEGFRNGTCLPFQLFDVEENRVLDVWEMPLAIMESTLFSHRRLDVEAAMDATVAVLEQARRFGGVCVALWHNILWDELDFPGWGRHFEETLAYATEADALVASLEGALAGWHPARDAAR